MYITEKPAASTQTTFIWNRDYTSPSLPLCAFSLFLYLSLSKTYLSPSSLPFCLSLLFSRPVKTFLRGAFTLVPDTAKYLGCHRESASNQMARGFYTRIVCVCARARRSWGLWWLKCQLLKPPRSIRLYCFAIPWTSCTGVLTTRRLHTRVILSLWSAPWFTVMSSYTWLTV